MPIYEYECRACGHQFEEWQKISDPPVKKCPSCGKRQVDKIVSMSSFHLKGGGWYADLYGSTTGKNGGSSTKSNGTSKSSAKSPKSTKSSAKDSSSSGTSASASKS